MDTTWHAPTKHTVQTKYSGNAPSQWQRFNALQLHKKSSEMAQGMWQRAKSITWPPNCRSQSDWASMGHFKTWIHGGPTMDQTYLCLGMDIGPVGVSWCVAPEHWWVELAVDPLSPVYLVHYIIWVDGDCQVSLTLMLQPKVSQQNIAFYQDDWFCHFQSL